MADEEKTDNRPKCKIDLNGPSEPYKPCDSEDGLRRVSSHGIGKMGARDGDTVCRKHISDIWGIRGVEGIDPL